MIIPGFPVMVVGAKKLPQFIASSGATGTTSLSISIPASAQVGDLMVLVANANSNGTTTVNLPSGFTNIFSNIGYGNSNQGSRCCWKFVTQADKTAGSVSVSITEGGVSRCAGIIQFWRDCIQPGTGASNQQGIPSSSTASINVQTDGNAFALFHCNTVISAGIPTQPTPPSGTEFDRSVTSGSVTHNTRVTSATEHNLPAGASGTRTWSTSGHVYTVQIRSLT